MASGAKPSLGERLQMPAARRSQHSLKTHATPRHGGWFAWVFVPTRRELRNSVGVFFNAKAFLPASGRSNRALLARFVEDMPRFSPTRELDVWLKEEVTMDGKRHEQLRQ